ncbi:MAG: DUF3795 domain-containing protein [Promethearchaeota archaeon]|nr:MAG: DUF3795 domain-containing protein [Candidatus Lokiarchaeota archaeon]
MTYQLDSYCGLYCGACFVMIAFKQNRDDCIPKEWINQISDKDLKCYGCKSDEIFENCQKCGIRKCARTKNIEFCSECSDYPCEKIKYIQSFNLAHHNVAFNTLKTIEKIGVEPWLNQQEKRWLCSNCGSPFSWYEENCFQCGTELFNSIKEERKLKNFKLSSNT